MRCVDLPPPVNPPVSTTRIRLARRSISIMSLSFLFCKPWHPATTWNQKKIWEAEQADLKRKKDEAVAKKELKRDSDRRFYESMAGGKTQDASSAALNFMYNPPPGYQHSQEQELNDDDEAVKKFKALAKMKADPNFSAAASCSELEKLVGRRKNPGVSLAEQQERFPFLKNAPVEHAYAAGVKVNFKPFNNVVRHVRCMRCGEWGHRSGDRECKVAENPNDAERQIREDPMSYMAESSEAGAAAGAPSGAGGSGEIADPDSEFVNSLSTRKKRRLLRLLQKMEAEKEGGGGQEKKRSKKGDRKGSRKKRRERDDDDCSGSGRKRSKERKKKRGYEEEEEEEERKAKHRVASPGSAAEDHREGRKGGEKTASSRGNEVDGGHRRGNGHRKGDQSEDGDMFAVEATKHRKRGKESAREGSSQSRREFESRVVEEESSDGGDIGAQERRSDERGRGRRHRSTSASEEDERAAERRKIRRKKARDTRLADDDQRGSARRLSGSHSRAIRKEQD